MNSQQQPATQFLDLSRSPSVSRNIRHFLSLSTLHLNGKHARLALDLQWRSELLPYSRVISMRALFIQATSVSQIGMVVLMWVRSP